MPMAPKMGREKRGRLIPIKQPEQRPDVWLREFLAHPVVDRVMQRLAKS